MKDITDLVVIKELPRVAGKRVMDELWYAERKIGHMETQGPVFNDVHYQPRFRPNRRGVIEQRWFLLDDSELASER